MSEATPSASRPHRSAFACRTLTFQSGAKPVDGAAQVSNPSNQQERSTPSPQDHPPMKTPPPIRGYLHSGPRHSRIIRTLSLLAEREQFTSIDRDLRPTAPAQLMTPRISRHSGTFKKSASAWAIHGTWCFALFRNILWFITLLRLVEQAGSPPLPNVPRRRLSQPVGTSEATHFGVGLIRSEWLRSLAFGSPVAWVASKSTSSGCTYWARRISRHSGTPRLDRLDASAQRANLPARQRF